MFSLSFITFLSIGVQDDSKIMDGFEQNSQSRQASGPFENN